MDEEEAKQQTERNRILLTWLMDLHDRKKALDEDLAKWEKAFHADYDKLDAAMNGETGWQAGYAGE